MVLVVDESQRFYVDLAAHVTYAIADDDEFAIESFVHLRQTDDIRHSLDAITNTLARGSYGFSRVD